MHCSLPSNGSREMNKIENHTVLHTSNSGEMENLNLRLCTRSFLRDLIMD